LLHLASGEVCTESSLERRTTDIGQTEHQITNIAFK